MTKKFLCFATILTTGCHETIQENVNTDEIKVDTTSFPCHFNPVKIQRFGRISQPKLDSVAVSKVIQGLASNGAKFPPYSRFEDFYFLENNKCEDFSVLTFMHKDESCCSTIYFVSSLSGGHNYIDCIKVALIGSDGDWQEEDSFEKSVQGINVVRLIREDVEDSATGKYTSIIKTTIRESIVMNRNGFFQKTRLDSTSIEQKKRS